MESEEFKVVLVIVLGIALVFAVGAAVHNAYYCGLYEGKVSILQPKEAK